MTLEDFKDVYKDKTPAEMLDLLAEQHATWRHDAVAREKSRDSIDGGAYYANECRAMEARVEWIMGRLKDALKAQEPATIKPKRIDLEEETKAWLDKMDAVDALGNIADICIDWDGYRTADGLGGLINEIWAYARYCSNRLVKEQEPVEPIFDEDNYIRCGKCKHHIVGIIAQDTGNAMQIQKYCSECGQAVKWE